MYPDQAPAPEQAPVAPIQPTPPQYAAPAPATDPGKTLGIVGFILAFLVSIAGIIVSSIGLAKSRKAGFKNPLALAGIIIGSVLTVVSIGFFILITLVAYNGVQDRALTLSAQDAADSAAKQSEVYSSLREDAAYPQHIADLKGAEEVGYTLTVDGTQATQPLTSAPSTPKTFEFHACEDESGTGNKIGYWDYTTNEVAYIYTGGASSDSTCTFSAL